MHDQLTAHPDTDSDNDVTVHVIWAPVLGGDRQRARQATAAINGPNVIHYWDPGAVIGEWAHSRLPWPLDHGPAWDVFYLFDGEAVWTDQPGPVVATGYTIVSHRDDLATGLAQIRE